MTTTCTKTKCLYTIVDMHKLLCIIIIVICTYYFFVWFRVLKELVDHPDKMVLMDLEALLDQGEVLENKDLPDLQ